MTLSKRVLLTDVEQHLVTNNIRILIDQFIVYSRESRGHSEWTVRTRQTHLKQFNEFCERIGILEIPELNHQIIDAHFTEYTRTHSKSTTNTGRRILKVFLRWADNYKEMQLPVNPESIRLVREADRLPRAIDVDVIKKVIQQAKHAQDALVIAVMFEAGLRIGELVELRVSDFKGDSIRIRGKGDIDRTVYITDALSTLLATFAMTTGRSGLDYLFQNVYEGYANQLTIGTARLRIQRCFKLTAGVHMYPHQLRHSFAINLLQAGCDIVTIQNLMGHRDVTTTQVYLRVSNDYIRQEYKKYIGISAIA